MDRALSIALAASVMAAVEPVNLYDIALCPKCNQTYVVSKWPHRCLPKPGGPR